MITTPSLIIVTADDFPIFANAHQRCEQLIADAGAGKHLYGGKHYRGHHVVFKKRWFSKGCEARRLKLHNAFNAITRLS